MLNKLLDWIRCSEMIAPRDIVVCAVSGGADSVAMLFALYLLRQKLGITLEAAHFNHHLRGEESQRDEDFVRTLCQDYEIPLHVGGGTVTAGEKGLEAAAREARYEFLESLPGKIATAHTADDNAETVLLHLIRGTGLKGLGGIAPIRGRIIRPMLTITRREVEDFLVEWNLPHVEDSTNQEEAFLRNRIRHDILPLLARENPRIRENLSDMALRLREDEALLEAMTDFQTLPKVDTLRRMLPAQRSRCLERFLKDNGVREPEQSHVRLAESLVFSDKPSARASFPGGIVLTRCYDRLEVLAAEPPPGQMLLPCPGEVSFGCYLVTCRPAEGIENSPMCFTVCPEGEIFLRSRQPGDRLTLSGGTKSLKKLLIDRKIPQSMRDSLPVVEDGRGILGVGFVGVHQGRAAKALPAVTIRIKRKEGL